MSALFTAISRAFPRELVSHLAARLGEGQTGMKRALEGVLPMMLGAMARRAETADAQLFFEWSSQACQTTPYRLGSVTGMLGILGSGNGAGSAMTQGQTLLQMLFGNAWPTIAAAVSHYAQVKCSTASTLLTLVGAVLPGLLGQYAERHHLSAKAATANLIGIKNQLNILLPLDLRAVADSLGLMAKVRPPKQIGLHWERRGISWMLVLMAVLGMAGPRSGRRTEALPAAAIQPLGDI